ncbi:L-lactate MFS transporter [Reichenbachiella ulvae]|uniref:OFA family MFS transporter n=1 Tax=Reichenbachiella ulvae TaxID=2980104 RepID=A0ABT3CRE7_9BACT|nr:OFA family MFS transporter [Reichenbachiella ulvae]MCV9386192.1 OFA family MFS transporter [Reichenbachiella ulvae]
MEKIKNRWLIAASAVGIHVSIGAVYAYSVLKKPLLEGIGWEFKQTAWAFSIAILFLGLSAAFLGRKVEKMGPRKSGMLAASFYGVGLVLAGLAIQLESVYLFYLGYGVISGIGLGVGYICPVSTLVKWFPDRRGLATGLAIMGFGFGALLASSIIQFLIVNVGLAFTFYILGVAYFVIMMSSAQYLAPPPADWVPEGFEADGKTESKKKIKTDLAQVSSIEALSTVRFYYLWLMLFLNVTCGIAVISIASPLSQEIAGLTPVAAAAMVGAMGLFNGLGRIGWASFSDVIGRPMTYTAFFVLQIGAFFLLPQTTNAVVFQVLVFLILTCYGGGFASIPAYIGDVFGTKNLSAIHGNILTAWAAAGLVGPQLAAYVREATGSYTQTLYIFAGLFVLALVISILIQFNIRSIKEGNKVDKEPLMPLNKVSGSVS